MAEKSIIGIDFGTSTSVVRVKDYNVTENSGTETWRSFDRNPTMAYNVTFNNGQVMVPTLVQKISNATSKNAVYYGYDATVVKKGQTLYQNFKIDLEGEYKEEARALTQEFLTYLHGCYQEQHDGGHLGNPSAAEKTIISYPVKWSEDTRNFMIEAAKKAGFKNVEGMDEAQAAIIAVTTLSQDMLTKKNYLINNTPVNIMLVDMGAGTTDIVICRYTPGNTPINEILCTWPEGGDILFGGRELDELLQSYIIEKIPEEGRAQFSKKIGVKEYKAWKEGNVSGSLARNESITSFDYGDMILSFMDMEMDEFNLDRAEFEKFAADYIDKFPKLINGSIEACVSDNKLTSADDIDLVILTGGHSQWYFVREMLLGVGDKINLGKIKVDPGRLIDITKPQETVALGLVYSKLPQKVSSYKESKPQKEAVSNFDDAINKLETPQNNNPPRNNTSQNTKSNSTANNNVFIKISENPLTTHEKNEFRNKLKIFFNDFPFNATNNLLVFKNTLKIPADAEIYVTSDTSMFRRGKNGFAACSSGLHFCEFSASDTFVIPWSYFLLMKCTKNTQLNKIQIGSRIIPSSFLINKIEFWNSLFNKLKTTIFYDRIMNELIIPDEEKNLTFYTEIDTNGMSRDTLLYYKYNTRSIGELVQEACQNLIDLDMKSELDDWLYVDKLPMSGEIKDDFVSHVKDFQENWLDYAYRDGKNPLASKAEEMIFRAEYNIDDNDDVFFARDTSNVTDANKSGIAFCLSGIHYHTEFDGNWHILPWDLFLLFDLESYNSSGTHVSGSKTFAALKNIPFARKTTYLNAVPLYKQFQEFLKKTKYYELLKQQAADPKRHFTFPDNTPGLQDKLMYYSLRGVAPYAEMLESKGVPHVYGLTDVNEEIRGIYLSNTGKDS